MKVGLLAAVGVQVERLDDWAEVVNGREFELVVDTVGKGLAGKNQATMNPQPTDFICFETSITWY